MTDTEGDRTSARGAGATGSGVPAPPDGHRTSGQQLRPEYETGGVGLALLVAAIAAVGFMAGWSWVLVILGVVIMIFLHELGHYLTARSSGMKVTEFFIGFGPKIWSFRRGETEYGIKPIPAGAYVRIVGMHNLEEVPPEDEPRTYRQQSFPKRLLVVSAGSLMHFAQAFVLLVVLLGVVGFGGGSVTNLDGPIRAWEVGTVSPDSAAADAGLQNGDRILALDGRPASAYDDFRKAIESHAVGDTIALTIDRDGVEVTKTAELGERPESEAGGQPGGPFLGVGTRAELSDEPIGVGTAIVRAPGEMVTFGARAVGALGSFFSPEGINNFANQVGEGNEPAQGVQARPGGSSGEVDEGNRLLSIYGAIRLAVQLSENGWAWLLFFFFQINMFIGIFNMVPLPPLDGGHAAVAIYERVRSRNGQRYHADMAKLIPLTYAVVMGLVILGVTALYLDIVNPVDL